MSKTQEHQWQKAFKGGQEVVVKLHRSGRPSKVTYDENYDKIIKLLFENRPMSLRVGSRDEDIF